MPLAVLLWKGGMSFGGVIAFMYADLLILPILNSYRKYYGTRMAAFLLVTFFAAIVVAGHVVEFAFGGLGLIPNEADAKIPGEGITWTTPPGSTSRSCCRTCGSRWSASRR
ncbi:permease [Streptomyces mirabilis]|uniref:permease n=1 Tax=Streptomyces mirabilis TaxID=68239 RepID=UPI0036B852EC